MSPLPGRAARSRGTSVVEFALSLPVLILLFGGLLDLGRGYYFVITVTDAAREGARTLIGNSGGSGPGTSVGCSIVQAAVVDLDPAPTCPTTSTQPPAGRVLVGVTCPASSGCVGDPTSATHNQPVTVDVYYGFQPFTPLIGSFTANGVLTLHAHAVMNASW
jgi:Flp pilus assembly protein TadG